MSHPNPSKPPAASSSSSSTAPFARSLLNLAHPSEPLEASRIYSDKIHRKTFPLRPTEKKPTTTTKKQKDKQPLNARDIRRLSRSRRYTSHKPRPLSARETRALGLHDIPPTQRKYALYEPLHALWVGYMRELLSGHKSANPGTAARVSGADLHGCLLTVVRSRCPSRVGLTGIVVKETKMTFFVVTKGDEVKSLPKEYTVFRFEVPHPDAVDGEGGSGGKEKGEEGEEKEEVKARPMVFELHGSNFLHRSSERANKKWKPKPMTDL